MLPSRCCIRVNGRECMKMPQWIVSIVEDKGEYMVAVVCNEHRAVVADLINDVNINFTRVKSVATACSGLKF